MQKITFFLIAFLVNNLWLNAQRNWNFLGAGHDQQIRVTTSHHKDNNHRGEKSVDGFPVQNEALLADASRFLSQATLGEDYTTIQMTAAMGFEAWLEEQFQLRNHSVWKNSYLIKRTIDEEGSAEKLGSLEMRTGWWHTAMTSPGQLRQRLALAFSELFVVSDRLDILTDAGDGLSHYYDQLSEKAFGNYRDLLFEVSTHPVMGLYLSHFNNPKADPERNTHPDENYAREVMQLFSIGLYELNPDGTRKKDSQGNFIPTYDNLDIKELAKVFTGYGDGSEAGQFGYAKEEDIATILTTSMDMYSFFHEPQAKTLLSNLFIPANQNGDEDVNQAIDHLSRHPNVAPFIAKSLIRFMVTSNPTPAYVARIAEVFNDSPEGKGDLKSVIKAILLDPEARSCNPLDDPFSGKLREPILRYTQTARAFQAYPAFNLDVFVNFGKQYSAATGQYPLNAPSVFNFFQPEYQPNGPIAEMGLFAPEFQIHNTNSAIGYINMVEQWTFQNGLSVFWLEDFDPGKTLTEFGDFGASSFLNPVGALEKANDPSGLVNYINIVLAGGQLSDRTQAIIQNAIEQLTDTKDRVNMAIYLTLISPDYAVVK